MQTNKKLIDRFKFFSHKYYTELIDTSINLIDNKTGGNTMRILIAMCALITLTACGIDIPLIPGI